MDSPSIRHRHFRRLLALSSDAWINIAILLTCGVVLVAVMERRAENRTAIRQNAPEPFRTGEPAEALPGVTYQSTRGQRTLVMYVSSACHFCAASMPFYEKLHESAVTQGTTRLVAVSDEPASALSAYLRQHNVDVDKVVSYGGRAKPTPTLVLVDSSGVIRSVWVGQQTADGEQAILKAIS